ncbi:polysaccharide deacetylase family protein [Candidatus Peregrinibacteria bacterium]|nr:polysaccharide deacetylase family protein [Candidatus Peregrinibacteria bacterium]
MENQKTKTKKRLILFALSVLAGFAISGIDYFKTPEFNSILRTDTLTARPVGKILPAERYKYSIINNKERTFHLKPNSKQDLELKIKNTGKLSWNITSKSLTASADTTSVTIINPEDTFNLKFNVKTASGPGFYSATIDPIVADKNWKTNNKMKVNIVVDGDFDKSYQYELLDQKPLDLMKNVSTRLSVKIKNTGAVTWYGQGQFPVQLMADKKDNTWLPEGIIATMQEQETAPGQIATFNFNITAPATIVDFELKFKLAIGDNYVFKNPLVLGINIVTKKVAITVDDGYGNIDAFVDLFNRENVRATFFMLGCVVESNPKAMRRIVDEGHMLANHSYCHPDFRTLTDDKIRWELSHTREIMQNVTGHDVYPYFRYPYGAMNERTNNILKEEGWKYFPWTQSTDDYHFHQNTEAGRNFIYRYAISNPPDNAIILMHTFSQSSLAVLPDVIQWYRDHGYTFVTVDQL